MSLLQSRRLTRIAFWLWCLGWLVISGLLLLPLGARTPAGSDLLAHFGVFACMAFGAVTFCRRPLTLSACALLTGLAGGALEVGQALVPYRTFSTADLIADGLGVALGWALALLVLHLLIRPDTSLAGARPGG